MACECINEIDAMLKPHNTRLSLTIAFGPSKLDAFPTVLTEQIEKGRGKPKAKVMVPSYCPFCGTRYSVEPAAAVGGPS